MPENRSHILLNKLDEFIRKYYKNQLIRGGIYSFSAVVLFYLILVVAEFFAHFGPAFRTVLFYSYLATASFILVKLVAIPLFKLYRLGQIISYDQAAKLIGNFFPEVQDKLTNTLQLQKQLNHDPAQASLLNASIQQRIDELQPVPFTSAIDLTQNKKYLKYAIPPALLFVLILFGAPSVITDGTQRLVKHGEEFMPKAPFQFVIENKSLESPAQEDFLLKVRMVGEEVPGNVFVKIGDDQFKLQKENTISFRYTFHNLQESVRFRLFADGFYSDEYEIKTMPKPVLLDFNIELDYPDYMGKQDEVISNTGDLVVPIGTNISWSFHTENTEQVRLHLEDTLLSISRQQENQFVHKMRVMNSQQYTITTGNTFVKSSDSINYQINVIPDDYPSIEVEQRVDSISSKRLYFKGLVTDDYGFSALKFSYRFIQREGKPANDAKSDIELSINRASTQEQFFHFWDFDQLQINSGDEIEYYFEIWDNDGVNGSKSVRSKTMTFKAPTLSELSAEKEKRDEQIKKELNEGLKEARELKQDIKKLNQKLFDKKEISWQEKKQIKNILDKQNELSNKIERIQEQNKESQRKQNEYKELDPELLEKQRQLEKLFDELMTPEMKEMFDELEKLMDEANKEKIQEMLKDMEKTNEDFEKDLDRSLEIFKQLEFEQKLDEAIEKLDELAEKQEELSEESESKDSDSQEIKERQDELNKEFEEFRKDLDELEKKNEELEFSQEMEDTDQDEQNIQEEMEKSSDELNQDKKKDASESQKNAADKMKEMAQKMSDMQQKMQEQQQGEDLNAIRQLLENLVQLSFDQEDLMGELKQTNPKDPKYVKLIQGQKKLKDDARIVEDSLIALSKRQPMLENTIIREIGEINLNMKNAIELLSDQPPRREYEYIQRAAARQQYAMTAINNLAVMLDAVAQQMQQSMSQQKYGDGSCNKPGNGQGSKPSMSSMKKMQQQLSQQIKDMQKKMNGNKPGGKDGQGSTMFPGSEGSSGQMSKELARMAAQQEALRNELRKIAEGMSEEKGSNGSGGQMDELQKLMEENETDLVNKRITLETIKRQQEIMTRLLESEKAEREREMDPKRESNEAEDKLFARPEELFKIDNVNDQEIELLKTVPPSLKPFYKRKVNEYFHGFN